MSVTENDDPGRDQGRGQVRDQLTAGIDWASSAATVTLRMTVRARKDLVAARVAMANQLRAHLQTTLPGAVGPFRDIDSPISLGSLTRFPTQDKADWLSRTRLENWLRAAHYNNPRHAPVLHAHSAAATRGTTGSQATARASITLALVANLTMLREQIRVLDDTITAQLEQHPDAKIFTSLPRSGTLRAARLLAEIGDARGRFPTPEALTCLAGAAPSTPQSGKHKVVSFRWAVDKQLRGAVIDFAGDSHHANPPPTSRRRRHPTGADPSLAVASRELTDRMCSWDQVRHGDQVWAMRVTEPRRRA